MSLFQACKQATTSSRRLAANVTRALATDSVSPHPEMSKKETDIVAPAQDVMVADVISGAPGADFIALFRETFL